MIANDTTYKTPELYDKDIINYRLLTVQLS